jgi:hypothetical protein
MRNRSFSLRASVDSFSGESQRALIVFRSDDAEERLGDIDLGDFRDGGVVRLAGDKSDSIFVRATEIRNCHRLGEPAWAVFAWFRQSPTGSSLFVKAVEGRLQWSAETGSDGLLGLAVLAD